MILYIYSKCSTCQQALRFLEQRKIHFVRKEITETPPTRLELEKMLHYAQGNLKKLFNTSGQLYREMQLTEKLKEMPLQDALTLLTKQGMLVKRPFLIDKSFGLTGFNAAVWDKTIA